MRSICFTGHRKIPGDHKTLEMKLYHLLERAVVNQGVFDFYAGGAVGWDELAALTVLKLREVYPRVRLHLILPCPNEEQTATWTTEQKTVFYRILALADTVEYISKHYYDGCMKARNARLVELADCCFCFLNPVKQRSGTAQTVRFAQRKKILIVNFFQ